jgi:hypothetical protein
MPVGDILVGDARGYIKHYNPTLSVDIVSISETTEFLLTCGIPDIEVDLSEVLSRFGLVIWEKRSSEGQEPS